MKWKLGLVAGWQAGQVQVPSYVAAREPARRCAERLRGEAARRGALDVTGRRGSALDGGGHEAVFRLVVMLGDRAKWIGEEVAASFGCERVEIVDWYHGAPRGAVYPCGVRDPTPHRRSGGAKLRAVRHGRCRGGREQP